MKIIESFLRGKNPDQTKNEDGIVMTNNAVIVVDGVTSKGIHMWGGKRSGCFAKEILCNYISDELLLYTPEKFFQVLSDKLKAEYDQRFDTFIAEEMPRANIVVYNNFKNEVWLYGDCQFKINNKLFKSIKKIDYENAVLRAKAIKEALQSGITIDSILRNDIGRELIQDRLINQFNFENIIDNYGYPVINGGKIEPQYIIVKKVKIGDEVVLGSDGYPYLLENLKQSEQILADLLTKDPLCINELLGTKAVQPGFESFDDRAYCRILID